MGWNSEQRQQAVGVRPSFVINPASHTPRSAKSFWMAGTATGDPAGAETIIGNCTITIPLQFVPAIEARDPS